MKQISIPTLSFFPFKLNSARKRIENEVKKTLGDIESPDMFENDEKLNHTVLNLIKIISRIKSEQELVDFSRKLKDIEICYLLSYLSYNYNVIDNNTKINIIKLTYIKPKEIFIKHLWLVFQFLFTDLDVINALNMLFNRHLSAYKKMEVSEQNFIIIKDWIAHGANITYVINYFMNIDISFSEIQDKFAIKEDRPLFKELCWNISIYTKSINFFCDSNNIKHIYTILEQTYSHEKFFKFYNNYLNVLDIKYFNKKLIEILINRYGEPNKPKLSQFWNLFNENSKMKLTIWLNEQKLLLFFNDDNERFIFWKQFVSYMEYIYPDKQNYRVFMFFKNIVIIEFGNVGNALYAYSKDYFKSKFEFYMKKSKSNDFFKDKFNCLFRIIHQSNWQYNIKQYLQKYEELF